MRVGGSIVCLFTLAFHAKGIHQVTNIPTSLFLLKCEALQWDLKLFVWQDFVELWLSPDHFIWAPKHLHI